MGEKKNADQHKEGRENKKKESKNNVNTVVLKADLHCDGCASKVLKCIRTFDGVETATIGEGLITVAGKIDPAKLREKVEQKTHKRVELVSPPANKDNNNYNNGENNGTNKKEKKENNNGENKENVKGKENNGDNKKSKETKPPLTTAVMKVHLHCEGCIQKIGSIVTKTKGYMEMKIDKQKELVTVTGAMDMKALASVLKKRLKKDVEIVPPKKESEKKENGGGDTAKNGGGEKAKSNGGGGDKAKNGGGGGDKAKNGGGGGDKAKSGGDGDGDVVGGGGEKMENRMQYQAPYPYPSMYGPGGGVEQFHYNPYPVAPYHAPQMFSDENPNACSVM
ncbi:hypothetical protein BUALT_Bualt02G0039600 [Buddleja alternifolia]|uniref:HMA domain-containing protein n=1 Tax=Buddleja alternifolia TaxID=168488 RepID=A0AAV6Y8F0_9LAMI|nr:hypothetical protein BUALT_Bualt02G0039600 [Buddleja alternifolia]